MNSNIDIDKITANLAKVYKNICPIFGGDGTLVKKWRTAFEQNLVAFPIRNYSLCEYHHTFYERLSKITDFSQDKVFSEFFSEKNIHQYQIISGILQDKTLPITSISETQIKNKDITSALRFDIYVNDKKYYSNVIADGIVLSTPLGSTGYWKSLTRTIFRDGWGITFIAPTQGVNSVILKVTDEVKIKFIRYTDLNIAYDKIVEDYHVNENNEIKFSLSTDTFKMLGYNHFMCFDCRKNRNSTILQNQFIVE